MSQDDRSRLSALVANCAQAGVARQVLLLRIGDLPPALTRPHHFRLAEAALAPLLRLPRAELFRLPGPSLAVAWRGNGDDALLETLEATEHLLSETTVPLSAIAAIYDLPETGTRLLEAITPDRAAAPLRQDGGLPLDPASLVLLETCLNQAELSRFTRRTPVWRRHAGAWSLEWEDRSLCLEELSGELASGRDLRAEPWLARRLYGTLDRRILSALSHPGELGETGPFAISLNVQSLLAPDFLRFDAALPLALRGRVVLAITDADMVANARTAEFALSFARTRFYRPLLRLDDAGALDVMAPALALFDYVALPWAPHLAAPSRELANRLVLTACETEEALAWGLDAGLHIFSGRAAAASALA